MRGLRGLNIISLSDVSKSVYLIGELSSGKGWVGENMLFIEITLIILPGEIM